METASAVDIMREFDSVCLESDSGNVNNMAAATSDTCANVKTPSKKSSSKSRSSTSASKNKSTKSKVSVDSRIDLLEKKIDEQLGSILLLVQTLANPSSSQRDTGVLAPGQRSVLQDDHPAGVSGPVSEEAGPIGTRRPLIPLENDIDSDFAIQPVTLRQDHPDDTLSLTPAQREKDSLGLLSDNDDSVSCKSVGTDSVLSLSEARKANRFCQYLSDTPEKSQNNLAHLFGEEAGLKQSSETGICLDRAQIDTLSKTWRCEHPERLSAFRDEYRSVFPVHDSSLQTLQVPSLDDLLEPMLSKRHGSKAVKAWGRNRTLATQPLKAIESVAFQGQSAARYGIIAVSYMQQALGSLLNKLQSDYFNIDSAIQSVRDIFAMFTKALDQVGRAGAFHHIVRRKAAASDTGLNNLRDVQAKVLYLPLSGEGVFGKGLEGNLQKRKEQKEQLSDLVPDFAQARSDSGRKRKLLTTGALGTTKDPGLICPIRLLFNPSLKQHTRHIVGSMMTRSPAMATRRDQKTQVIFGFLLNRGNDSKVNLIQQCPQIPVGGRLRFFLENWKKITDDQWVLSLIEEGYKLEFIQKPPQSGMKETIVPRKNLDILNAEVAELLRKDAIEKVPPNERGCGFYSTFFLVPKKNGKMRPVINLRPQNRYLKKEHFKMDTLKKVINLVKPNDWAISLDLSDAYLHIPIFQKHRKYLRFCIAGQCWQWKCLCFGPSTAPRVFSKVISVIAAHLRAQNIRLASYLDDWLALNQLKNCCCKIEKNA